MKLGIYTIEKTLFEGNVKEIVVKTIVGELTILPHHSPIISRLVEAPVKIIDEAGQQKLIDISSGFIEVQPESKVVILAESLKQ